MIVIGAMVLILSTVEDFILKHCHDWAFLEHHISHPISLRITSIGIIILTLITTYHIVEYVAIKLGFWTDGLSIHDIPEHCAHVYVKVSVSYQNEINQVDYKLEFSPEEYSKDQPEFGTDLRFLKRKVYFLVKDSKIYKELNEPFFRIDDVTLYYNGEQLTEHSKPLIQLGVRTGDTVAATVEIS